MDEVFYDEELDRQYDCEHCRDTGKLDGSDFYDCAHCGVAEQRMTLEERMCNLPRSMSIDDMVWAIVRSDRRQAAAVKAAEMALLKSKLLQAERELAEVRKDAERYRYLRDTSRFIGGRFMPIVFLAQCNQEIRHEHGINGADLDAAIDAASVAQANKEQGNG